MLCGTLFLSCFFFVCLTYFYIFLLRPPRIDTTHKRIPCCFIVPIALGSRIPMMRAIGFVLGTPRVNLSELLHIYSSIWPD